MSDAITIRLATLDDYPGFLGAARETLEHHVALLPDLYRSAEIPVPEEYFARLVTGDDSCIFLAECEGVVVGHAVLQMLHASYDAQVPRTTGCIGNFGVVEAWRRQGVGQVLFEACRKRAKALGASSLELDCWEANHGAIRFYEHLGMRVSRRTFTLDL